MGKPVDIRPIGTVSRVVEEYADGSSVVEVTLSGDGLSRLLGAVVDGKITVRGERVTSAAHAIELLTGSGDR